ncbi:MAG: hypothetical protein Q4D96_09250 [Propionibacteriaceae bacterium]|nr:hypothetical protein [Propionibacteriaceae bacterium]
MNTLEDQVRAAGNHWRQAQDTADKARAQRDTIIQHAHHQGVSKYRIAQWVGMTRVQVAAIIAKTPETPTPPLD